MSLRMQLSDCRPVLQFQNPSSNPNTIHITSESNVRTTIVSALKCLLKFILQKLLKGFQNQSLNGKYFVKMCHILQTIGMPILLFSPQGVQLIFRWKEGDNTTPVSLWNKILSSYTYIIFWVVSSSYFKTGVIWQTIRFFQALVGFMILF